MLTTVQQKMRITEVTDICLSLLGLALVLAGRRFPSMEGVFMGVGISLISTAVVSFLHFRYYDSLFRSEELASEWGLKAIYQYRAETNQKVNALIERGAKQIDGIVQGGMTALRQNLAGKLEEQIDGGLQLRLLIPQADRALKEGNEGVAKAGEDLLSWRAKLDDRQKERVLIREYNGAPQDLYFRVDNMVKVGPYLTDKMGSQTITYEFEFYSRGGKYYSDYFEKLWKLSRLVEDRK